MLYKIRRLLHKVIDEHKLKGLINNGLIVGENFSKQRGCTLDPPHCWLIKIGDDVTLAPHVSILAHDASTIRDLGYAKIGLVNIGNKNFIGAGAIILPNVEIGDNCIIGAGSVVTKDVPKNSVYAGNPAKLICSTGDYINKNKRLMETSFVYDESWTIRGKITNEQKEKMKNDLKSGIGFVR